MSAPTLHAPVFRAVVRRGWAEQRRAVLTWGGSLGVYGAFMAAIYPSIQDTIDQVSRNYPSALAEAFGVSSMSTVEGYLHAEMYSLIVPIALCVFAARSIGRPLVGAEEEGRLDTLLSLPLPRGVLVAGAFATTALLCAAIMVVTGVLTYVAGALAGTGISAGDVAAGVFGVWPLAVFFAGVAVLGTGLLHRSASVVGATAGAVAAMYAVDLASRLSDALEPLRWGSAFHYYGSPMLDGIDPAAFAGLTLAGVLLAVAGAWRFGCRDIRH